MHPRRFAIVMGLVFLIGGLLSFIPSFSNVPLEGLPRLNFENSYGMFMDSFAMNAINKAILLILGIGGLLAATAKNTSLPASIHYARWVFGVMGILAVLGMIPSTNTLFGWVPLYGNDIWMHSLFALVGAYFGYALTSRVPDQKTHVSQGRDPLHHG